MRQGEHQEQQPGCTSDSSESARQQEWSRGILENASSELCQGQERKVGKILSWRARVNSRLVQARSRVVPKGPRPGTRE